MDLLVGAEDGFHGVMALREIGAAKTDNHGNQFLVFAIQLSERVERERAAVDAHIVGQFDEACTVIHFVIVVGVIFSRVLDLHHHCIVLSTDIETSHRVTPLVTQ